MVYSQLHERSFACLYNTSVIQANETKRTNEQSSARALQVTGTCSLILRHNDKAGGTSQYWSKAQQNKQTKTKAKKRSTGKRGNSSNARVRTNSPNQFSEGRVR
jgi:hypothetical protein